MIKFSIFLIVIAFAALGIMLAPLVSPNDTSLLNVLEPILCNQGDTLLQEVDPNARRVDSSSNAFVMNMSFSCKRADGTTYVVTDKLFGIGMISFITFLVFGVLFLIIGIIRAMSGGGSKPQPAASTGWTPPYYVPTPTPTPSGGAYPTPQPGYSSGYPTTVGYNTPTVSVSTPPPSDKFNFDAAQTMQNIPKPSTAAASSSGQGGELTSRLKQLREAFDSGLISSEEYERTKSDLLRDFSDDN